MGERSRKKPLDEVVLDCSLGLRGVGVPVFLAGVAMAPNTQDFCPNWSGQVYTHLTRSNQP